jgi:hypothetical protein
MWETQRRVDEGKRTHRHKISFSDAEIADLRARARADERSVADFIYRLVIHPQCNCHDHG